MNVSVVDAELVIEPPEHRGQHLRQIFRDQAGARLARGLAVHPDPDAGGLERRHALRQQPAIIPASTSPAPAVASQGGALAAMVARPSGEATTVSGPLSRTTAPQRSAAARTRSSFERVDACC